MIPLRGPENGAVVCPSSLLFVVCYNALTFLRDRYFLSQRLAARRQRDDSDPPTPVFSPLSSGLRTGEIRQGHPRATLRTTKLPALVSGFGADTTLHSLPDWYKECGFAA